MDLGDMMDKIKNYDNVLTMFEFEHQGPGDKPWSIKHENKKGQVVEVRNSEWTIYENGKEIVGESPNELKRHLLKQLSKEELIDLVMW